MSHFEEGEYRAILFKQLEKDTDLLWEPGQVFEKQIGIDRASYCINDYFWNIYAERTPRPGVFLRGMRPSFLYKNGLKKGKLLPDFSLNLFIQAKRSYYSSRRKAQLVRNGILNHHWHFEINPDQQLTLEQLADAVGDKALVVYAAPLFHKQQELFNHTRNRSVLQYSTFPEAIKLSGHGKWFFDTAGMSGVANPDFEFIQGKTLISNLEELRTAKGEFNSNNVFGNLKLLAADINKYVDGQSRTESFGFNATQYEFYRDVIDDYIQAYDPESPEAVRAYLEIETFSMINKLDWLTF